MNRRLWLNVGLLILLAGLAWLAYEAPGLDGREDITGLTGMSPDQVTRITIRRPGKADLVFRKEDVWWMQSPVRVPARAFRIDSVLGIAGAQWRGRYDVAGLDLGKYGLDEPLATIFFDEVKIDFGGNEPLKRQRYVRMGDHVYLINDTLFYQLQASPAAYVSLTLLPPGNALTAIELPGLALVNEQGRWQATTEGVKLAPAAMDDLVQAWLHAEASQVTPFEGGSGQGEIVLRLSREPGELRLLLLQRSPELVVARRDIAMRFHFPAEQTRRLLPDDVVPAMADTQTP